MSNTRTITNTAFSMNGKYIYDDNRPGFYMMEPKVLLYWIRIQIMVMILVKLVEPVV